MIRYFFSMIQKMIEHKYKKYHGAKVLMFHQINNDTKKWVEESIAVSQDSFEELVLSMENAGFSFASPNELNPCDSKQVLLTFDDAFMDAYENGMKFLVKKGIPFCVFLSEKFINADGYIGETQLSELKKQDVCAIGYHTKSHKLMRKLKKNEVKYELDPKEFEKNYGVQIRDFAFPYGSVYALTHFAVAVARKIGFARVYITISVPYSLAWEKHHRTIPRINVKESNIHEIMGPCKK